MTLRELQAATFVSDSALSRYLAGRTVPAWAVVVALCGPLEVDPESLRTDWEVAMRRRPAVPAQTRLADTHAAITESIDRISRDVSASIRTLRAAGHQVPPFLIRAQRTSADAATHATTLRLLAEEA